MIATTSNQRLKPRRQRQAIAIAVVVLASHSAEASAAFCPTTTISKRPAFFSGSSKITTKLYSSVPPDKVPPPDERGDGDDDELGNFLNPQQESENLQKAREFMNEVSLPISFDETDAVDEDIIIEDDDDKINDSELIDMDTKLEDQIEKQPGSSSLVNSFGANSSDSLFGPGGTPSSALLAKNPYMSVVSKLSPSELISKFTASAHPSVQEAVRTTILGLIGSLPKMAFDTTTITTGQRLASLMFQLQMTGYMFKNAEYRLSMSQSLGMTNGYASNRLLTGDVGAPPETKDEPDPLLSGKVRGKLKIRYGPQTSNDGEKKKETTAEGPEHKNGKKKEPVDEAEEESSGGMEIEVDAAAYMSELRAEVSKLNEELSQTREAKSEALRKDLLLYIRTLPAQELKSLTETMGQDVLVCMKGLVQAVLGGIGDGKIGPETVTEQSGEAMAQLCMWQLAVGYNLRELEVREEMKKSLEVLLDEDLSNHNSFE